MAKKYDNTTGSSSQKGGAKSAISARDNSNAGIAELFCGFLTRTVYIYAVRMRLLLNNSENSALIGLKRCLQRPDDMLSTVHTWSLEQTILGQWTVVDSTFRRFLMRTCAYMYAGNISFILLSSTVHCPAGNRGRTHLKPMTDDTMTAEIPKVFAYLHAHMYA